ncbi:MAG TPA: NTP transferase domain-containing protein, partial [Piscinibacter sp.]|nr:NTP transferase domain-containing protein [Piscinibacter sp.]
MGAQPAVIVLAAGRGSRFLGADHKLAQRLGSATVFATTLRHAVATQLPVVVVTTQVFADVARRSVAARDVIVLPEVGTPGQEALGMGYSISSGVSAIPDAGGWLILPGDMPMVRSDTMLEVARELADHAVVYAQHKGVRGHPVGFSAELYS